MKGDKTRCKQFRSMFLFIPEQISCNIMIMERIHLLFHHSAKLLPVVLCQLTVNILGVETGQPSSQVLLGSLSLPQHAWWWVCARQPQEPLRGQECWGGISPRLSCVPPPTHVLHGEFPCCLPASAWPGTGLPERRCAGWLGVPTMCWGPSWGFLCFSEKAHKPICKYPPFELYSWLMFIEVFYLELISLKSVLMFAKIYTVPVPSCARLLAPFLLSAFFAYIVARVKWGNAQSWEIKDVNFINRNQRS